MMIDVLIEDARWTPLDLERLCRDALGGVLSRLALDPQGVEVSVLGCDDARIAALNGDFRGKPVPTNVLSWPAEDLAPEHVGAIPPLPDRGADGSIALGDIALAYETCMREAREAKKPEADHVTHLIVHGMLHLLGYDHVSDLDATLMQSIESEILGKMGIDDPY